MKVDFITNTNDDLMIANVARVSFNKWNKQLDVSLDKKGRERDPTLINYLAKEKHISPFFHPRITMKFDDYQSAPMLYVRDPALLMGAVWDNRDNGIFMQHSYYGWVNLYKEGYLPVEHSDTLAKMPAFAHANKAFGITESPFDTPSMKADYYSVYMNNYSLRITCPIVQARQLFTHRMFASNEVSRRYVDHPPTFYYPSEWRSRPEGSLKQGSGVTPLKIEPSSKYAKFIEDAESLYASMINFDVAPEQARYILPQSMNTSFVFTGSEISWIRMLELRLNSHAQKETQDLAKLIYDVLVNSDPEFSYSYNLHTN